MRAYYIIGEGSKKSSWVPISDPCRQGPASGGVIRKWLIIDKEWGRRDHYSEERARVFFILDTPIRTAAGVGASHCLNLQTGLVWRFCHSLCLGLCLSLFHFCTSLCTSGKMRVFLKTHQPVPAGSLYKWLPWMDLYYSTKKTSEEEFVLLH